VTDADTRERRRRDRAVWTPDDLGLAEDVPDRFADVEVANSDLKIDVDELKDDLPFDPRDGDALQEERDAALEASQETLAAVETPGYRRSALDSIRIEQARSAVVGAMRAEYLRRNYATRDGRDP
jgi:hypothetical protein